MTDTETIILTVGDVNTNNRPPDLHRVGNRQMNVNQHLTIFMNANDPDGDAIIYSVSGLQSWMRFSGNRFTASPKANHSGNYQLTFRASDGRLSDSETITFTVR